MWWSKALSWVIGEVSPLDYILGALLIAALGWSTSLKIETWSLKSSLSTCKQDNGLLITDKKLYEQAIAQGNKNAGQKQENADKVIEKEKIVYKDRIEYIKEYVHDSNKTECENAIAILMRNGM